MSEINIVIVGDEGTGKTYMLRKFTGLNINNDIKTF